ncbi:MAG: prohibitin family protein [Candidatus Competibacterales bacterium]
MSTSLDSSPARGGSSSPTTELIPQAKQPLALQRGLSAIAQWPRRALLSLYDRLHYVIVVVTLLLLLFMYFFSYFVVVIRAGEAGVLYRLFLGGVQTDYVYGEGVHILQPWNVMNVYNIRVQTTLHELTVLTNKGLPITLDLAVRYRPQRDLLGVLHQELGPDYIHTIVIPQIESVLRKNIGERDPEDVYTNREGVLTNIILRAIDEASRKYVQIDDIIIRRVKLPPMVKDAIDDKLVQQQRAQAYEFRLDRERQEAERKRIEATGIRNYQAIIAETLDEELLQWHGIGATEALSGSENAKIVVIGAGDSGLPIILGR